MATIRIATFNLENLDDKPNEKPTLAQRIALMRPQFLRVNANILLLTAPRQAREDRPHPDFVIPVGALPGHGNPQRVAP